MRFIKTYEQFRFEDDKDVEVLEPKTKTKLQTDEPIDKSLLGEEEIEDKGSYIDASGVIHIKNWKIY